MGRADDRGGGEGLGWEAWALLLVVGIGAGGVVLLGALVGVSGLREVAAGSAGAPGMPLAAAPALDPVRAAIGVVAASVLIGIAAWLIRTTDWREEDVRHTED